MQIVITQVAAEQVWAIRHRSLRIGQPLGTDRADEGVFTMKLSEATWY